ncbi:hypothetical protein TWF718_009356 [Orbilia javanica]|uniref:Piwi domain-containing protein n=1 Tax=Orbilia javanica TaxID=47235 RepID=A0AAN8MZL8_9PEZI
MADGIIRLLFGHDGSSPPEWLMLALAGGSRSRPCCRICGSYGHRRQNCHAVRSLGGIVKSGLRVGERERGRGDGEGWQSYGSPSRGGGQNRGSPHWRPDRGGRGRGSPGRGGSYNNSSPRGGYNYNTSRGGYSGHGGPSTSGQGSSIQASEMASLARSCSEDVKKEDDALVKRLLAFGTSRWTFPIRNEYNATTGTTAYVTTNYYELTIGGGTKIARFTFEIIGPNRSKDMIDSFIATQFPGHIHYLCPDYGGYLYAPVDWTPGKEKFEYTGSHRLSGHAFILSHRMILNIGGYRNYVAATTALTAGSLPLSHEKTENSVIPVEFQAVLMALNAILIRNPRVTNPGLIHEKGNTLYNSQGGTDLPRNPCDIDGLDVGGGGCIVLGLHASARPGSQRCLVNASKVTNVYYKVGPLKNMINLRQDNNLSVNLSNRRFTDKEERGINRFLAGVLMRVDLPDGSSQYRIFKRLHDRSAEGTVWETQRGVNVTVSAYSRQQDKPLSLPRIQLLSFKPKRGSTDRCEFPLEWCTVAQGQKFRFRLKASGSQAMIKMACVPPIEYMQKLEQEFSTVFKRAESNPTLSHFGLEIGKDLLKVQARTLPMPRVSLGGQRMAEITPDQGSWRCNTFLRAADLWPYIVLEIRENHRARENSVVNGVSPDCEGTLDSLFRRCGQYGMKVETAKELAALTLYLNDEAPDRGIIKVFEEQVATAKRNLPKDSSLLVFCYLHRTDSKYYNAIKLAGDVLVGVLTICMDGIKIGRMNQQSQTGYFNTLALKVNLKCGGTNHSTAGDPTLRRIFPGIGDNSVMLFGADVSHSGRRDLPSIAAIVSSYESSHSRLLSDIRFQTNKEMIEGMKAVVLLHIKRFYQTHQHLPKFIVMFRDGVSESQYREVLDKEVDAIDSAIDDAVVAIKTKFGTEGVEKPKLTVLVVGKRHHTRFFPPNPRDDRDKTAPGLVVDRAVTAVYEKDFFLQAHCAIRGTPRPAHYFVIRDDMKLSDPDIQSLVFVWSFSFGRSFRSVSYAPPAYCADLACGRARAWIQRHVDDIKSGGGPGSGSGGSSGGSTDITTMAEDNLRAISAACSGLHSDLRNQMWYI